jgi:hypothetical protein
MWSRNWSAAHRCTTSCRFEASEAIPFPGADSIFSSRCGAISGRLRQPLAPRSPRPKCLGSLRGPDSAGSAGVPARRGAPAAPTPRFLPRFEEFKGLQGGKFPFGFAEGGIRRDRAALRPGEARRRCGGRRRRFLETLALGKLGHD